MAPEISTEENPMNLNNFAGAENFLLPIQQLVGTCCQHRGKLRALIHIVFLIPDVQMCKLLRLQCMCSPCEVLNLSLNILCNVLMIQEKQKHCSGKDLRSWKKQKLPLQNDMNDAW